MTIFAETLQRFMWGKIGSQKLSNLTQIPKSKIDSWLQGFVQRPREWQPILAIAQVLRLTRDEADTLLLAAGHRSIRELAETLALEHPDRRYLQPWLAAAPLLLSSRHQLRAAVGDFVGRTAEITVLEAALRHTAGTGTMATITGVQGMGGIGKTELAYVVANKLRSAFPDAQLVLALRGASPTPLTPEQALQTVIRAFSPDAELPEDLPTLETLYRTQLHEKRVLILADDARDTVQVRPLLPPEGSALLVTSRTRFTLPAMVTIDLDQLPLEVASALLRRICPRLMAGEAEATARACGCLPLALRVSGAILRNDRALLATAYLARLTDARQRFAQLRDPEDPELDVASALALSYAQLDAAAQLIFRQLGVFVADFATELALTVVEAPASVAVEATLRLLLRRNLVIYDVADGRWRLHDLVRDLARSYLETAGEYEAVMWRYAQAAVQIAQATQEQYQAGGDDTLAALVRFDTERPHIDEARRWDAAHAGTVAGDTLLVADALAIYEIGNLRYDKRHERLPQLIGAIAAARRLDDQRCICQLLVRLGRTYADLGAPHQVRDYAGQALVIAQSIGDRWSEGRTFINLAIAYAQQGAYRRAIPYLKQALTIAQEQGDLIAITAHLADLSHAYGEIGMFRHAMHYLEQARRAHQQQSYRFNQWLIVEALGRVYVALGDAQRAIAPLEHELAQTRAIRYHHGEGALLSILGQAYVIAGDHERAARAFAAALAILQEAGDRWYEAECAWRFGLLLAQQGELSRALPLLRFALAYEQEIGHARAEQHAAVLAQLEAGEATLAKLLDPAGQYVAAEDQDELIDDDLLWVDGFL
jgi:tetratricopeptide (TPR) repeat protein